MKTTALHIIFTALFLLAIPSAKAAPGDDTLEFFLSKSDLVVLGKITRKPDVVFTNPRLPNYVCEVEIQDVLKGRADLKGRVIKVNIQRFEASDKDKHPLVAKDAECILFLKTVSPNVPVWQTVDFWFGIQYPSPSMARLLKKLASEKGSSTS